MASIRGRKERFRCRILRVAGSCWNGQFLIGDNLFFMPKPIFESATKVAMAFKPGSVANRILRSTPRYSFDGEFSFYILAAE